MSQTLLINANKLSRAECLNRARSVPNGVKDGQPPSLSTKKIYCYITLSIMNIVLLSTTAHAALQEDGGISILPTLEEAVSNGNQAAVVLLIKARANVHTKVGEDREPLINTTESLEVIKLLLKARASVHDESSTLETPLHKAARQNKDDIVKFLIEQSANIYAKNMVGETPLTLAKNEGFKLVAILLEQEAIRVKLAEARFVKSKIELAKSQTEVAKILVDIDKIKVEVERNKLELNRMSLVYCQEIEKQEEAHRIAMKKIEDEGKALDHNEKQKKIELRGQEEILKKEKLKTHLQKEQMKTLDAQIKMVVEQQYLVFAQGVIKASQIALTAS